MNIYVNQENSGWIFDKIHADYKRFSRHTLVPLKGNPDVCWFLNPYPFPSVASSLKCPAFVHVHHMPKAKMSNWSFETINSFATGCIVPNKKTEETLKKYVNVPIYRIPYWLLSKRMTPRHQSCIEKEAEILIGSFQKDSEGKTNKPKLEKGPDIFLEVLTKLHKKHRLKVILTGYNRGYLIEGLESANIPFIYLNKVNNLNEIYDSIDWYFVTSRVEGGPQAVLEASYHKVKILSTDVGLAPEVLHPDCICQNVDEFVSKFEQNVDRRSENYKTVVTEYSFQLIIDKFDIFFEEQVRNSR